jgi:transcriptional regulator with XRE-family HTH domain
MRELLNATQLAKRLGVSPATVWEWKRTNRVDYTVPGKRAYFDLDRVREQLAQRTVKAREPRFLPRRRPGPSIAGLQLPATDWRAAT